ncbi:Breast cancer 1, early onset [Chamberlinius hualienensis]
MDVNIINKKVEVSLSHFQKILGCAICIDYLRSPMKTQCNHYFCKDCLNNLFKTSKNPAVCPVCKSPISKRSLQQSAQVETFVKTLLKLNATFENDLLSLVELKISKSQEEKNIVTDEAPVKLKCTDETSNIDDDAKLEGEKEIQRPKKTSESEVQDVQKDNQVKDDKSKTLTRLKKNAVKVKEIKIPETKRHDQEVTIIDDSKMASGVELDVKTTPNLPKEISSNFKVSQWLNDYCETPEEITCATELKNSTEIKKPVVGCNPSEDKKSETSDKIEDTIEVSVTLKRNTKFSKSLNETEIGSLNRTVISNDDPYNFPDTQKSASKSKRPTRQGPTTKTQPLHISTVLNETAKSTKQYAVVMLNKMDIEGERDPYALFGSPPANEKSKSVKKSRRRSKKAFNKGSTEMKKEHNSDTENELAFITSSLQLADSHKLNIEKDLQLELTKPDKSGQTELNKKRKLTSYTHSFTESQGDYKIDCLGNVVNKSCVDLGNGAYPKAIMENDQWCPSTGTSAKRIFANEEPDEEIMSVNSEKVIQNVIRITDRKPKPHVKFLCFGKLSGANNKFLKSTGSQTDDILANNANEINDDNGYIVKLTPIDSKLKPGSVIDYAASNSRVSVEENCLVDIVKRDNFDVIKPFVASSMVESTTEPMCTTNENATDTTPSKPSKRVKTKTELFHVADCGSTKNIKKTSSSTLARATVSSSKRLFDFSNEEKRPKDKPNPCKISTKIKNSYGPMKNRRRIVQMNDSDPSDSDQLPTPVVNMKSSSKRQNSCSPEIVQLDTLPYIKSQLSNELDVLRSSMSKHSTSGLSMLSGSNKENKVQLKFLSDDSINLINDESMDEQSGSEMLFDKSDDNGKETDEEIEAIFNEDQNSNDKVDLDSGMENLLYTSTPMKKQTEQQESNRICKLVDDEEEDTRNGSPLPSTANVTTQAFLKLKANIDELERKKRLMEMELEAAERESSSKLEGHSLPSSQSKVTTDQSMIEVSNIFSKEVVTSKTTGSDVASKMKSFNANIENAKMFDMEENTIVSLSPSAKTKWTPNRVIKSKEAIRKLPSAITAPPATTISNAYINSPSYANVKRGYLTKSYAFVTSGINAHQLKQVKQLVQLLKGSFSPSFTPKVTSHVIVNTGKNRLAERTFKYLTGISCGCWIVSFDWVVESLKAGFGLPEEDYEALGDNNDGAHGGPTKARLNPTLLLKDFQVLIMEPFKDLTKDQVVSLVENCGATIITHPSRINGITSKQLILADKNPNDNTVQLYSELHRSYGLSTVNRDWLLDSVASYTVKPLHNYILSTIDFPSSPSFQ